MRSTCIVMSMFRAFLTCIVIIVVVDSISTVDGYTEPQQLSTALDTVTGAVTEPYFTSAYAHLAEGLVHGIVWSLRNTYYPG